MKKGFFISLFFSINLFANTLTEEDRISLNKLSYFIKVVKSQYVNDLSLEDIIDKTIKGLMFNLDPHSTYLTREDFKDLNSKINGKLVGVGIVVSFKEKTPVIVSTLKGTPAKNVGLKSGDEILKVNNKVIKGLDLDQISKLIRGKVGETLNLTVYREEINNSIDFEIKRKEINLISTESELIDKNLLITISSFDKNVTKNVEKILSENKEVEGVIIDLRDNPGGILSEATNLVDLFLNENFILSQKNRNSEEKYFSSNNTLKPKVPLVILVNEGSASASEIFSGVLQVHKRAIVVGNNTFGKGTVQQIIPMLNENGSIESGVKLTIAQYLLPNGESIQAKGIVPDIKIEKLLEKEEKIEQTILREIDLPNHLNNISNFLSLKKEKKINYDNYITEAIKILKILKYSKNL